jgi:hypothetical protein
MKKNEEGHVAAEHVDANKKQAAVAKLVDEIAQQWRSEQEQSRAQQERVRFNLD